MITAGQNTRRRDRWADWAVIGLVAVALAAGLVLRSVILSRTLSFNVASAGITGRYPANWVHETGEDPLLRVRDPLGGKFKTVLELRSRPLASGEDLALALDALTLERAGQVAAYKILDTDHVAVDGRAALRRTFAYAHVDRNPYVDALPVVVRGIDVALQDGDRLIIATLLAKDDVLDRQKHRLVDLLESLTY